MSNPTGTITITDATTGTIVQDTLITPGYGYDYAYNYGGGLGIGLITATITNSNATTGTITQ
jgi:hypothetical protein